MTCSDCEKEIVGKRHSVNDDMLCQACFTAFIYEEFPVYEKIVKQNKPYKNKAATSEQ